MALKDNFKISNALYRFEIKFGNHETFATVVKLNFETVGVLIKYFIPTQDNERSIRLSKYIWRPNIGSLRIS